jgi:hypothetical protein
MRIRKPLTEEQKEKHREASREYARAHAEENRARVKKWALENPDKARSPERRKKQVEWAARWKAEHPEQQKEHQRQAYIRRRYKRDPNEVCSLCGQPETATTRRGSGTKRLLQQDHDHKTNVLRGRICLDCNRGLGAFKDDPALLRAAATYIEKYRPPTGVYNGDTPLRDLGEL